MVVSQRIATAANMVTSCGTVADIGCDHCLSLIFLIENGRCQKGIGADVKNGPLKSARKNISNAGLAGKIELRLGDGLSVLKPGEADTILIAGMGGHLIAEILEKGSTIAKKTKELVLQPHSDWHVLRKYLHKAGYKIIDEDMIKEKEKYYVTIKAEHGTELYEKEAEYLYGKILIKSKNQVLKEFLEKSIKKNCEIIEFLKDKSTEKSVLKLTEITKLNNIIREVLKCL